MSAYVPWVKAHPHLLLRVKAHPYMLLGESPLPHRQALIPLIGKALPESPVVCLESIVPTPTGDV